LRTEPITPRLPIPSALVEQRFNDPIALERDVLAPIARLAARLATVLEQRGEGRGCCRLRCSEPMEKSSHRGRHRRTVARTRTRGATFAERLGVIK